MERFIDKSYKYKYGGNNNLKSSMERFIVSLIPPSFLTIYLFKIQYGEIYS